MVERELSRDEDAPMSISVHPTVCSKENLFTALPFFAPLLALKAPHYLSVIKPAQHVPTTFFVVQSTSYILAVVVYFDLCILGTIVLMLSIENRHYEEMVFQPIC